MQQFYISGRGYIQWRTFVPATAIGTMAKEVLADSIAGAVADKAVSKIVDSLGRQTPVGDKLQQL